MSSYKGKQAKPIKFTEDPRPKTERPNLQRGRVKKTDELTDGQRAFAHEYCVDFNKSAAALRAGFSERNPSDAGNELYKRPAVKALIDSIRAERAERYEYINDIIVERLLQIVEADISDYIRPKEEGGAVKSEMHGNSIVFVHPKDWAKNRGKLVKTIKIKKGQIEFSLHDAMEAIRLLAQHTGFIKPENSEGDVVINITGDRRDAKPAPEKG